MRSETSASVPSISKMTISSVTDCSSCHCEPSALSGGVLFAEVEAGEAISSLPRNSHLNCEIASLWDVAQSSWFRYARKARGYSASGSSQRRILIEILGKTTLSYKLLDSHPCCHFTDIQGAVRADRDRMRPDKLTRTFLKTWCKPTSVNQMLS